MAGILSALGSTLNVLEVFSDSDGTAKGIVKALRGKKMRMVRADGSMLKFINKYVVEPVIVIDSSLRNEEHLDQIIALHVDMFSGFYMQTFEVMTNIEGLSANTVIDTLATDNGGLTRAMLSGVDLALENRDYAGEIMYGNLDSISLSTEATSGYRASKKKGGGYKSFDNDINTGGLFNRPNDRRPIYPNSNVKFKTIEVDPYDVKKYENTLKQQLEYDKKVIESDQFKRNAADFDYNAAEVQKSFNKVMGELNAANTPEARTKAINEYNDWAQKENQKALLQEGLMDRKLKEDRKDMQTRHEMELQRDRLRSPREGAKAGLGRGAKELYIPEAIIRNIELTITAEMQEGKNKGREIIMNIPVTIKANILFTDVQNIVNTITPNGDEFRFSYRWDEYMSGAISLGDFIFASDLIKKYKSNRLKDKNSLMELINSRTMSANSKMIDNGFAGFEKYYNMVIINSDNLPLIEKQLRGKIHNNKYKEKFLEYIQGLSVTVVDNNYERIYIGLKDIRGTTDITFKTVLKTEKKGGADIGEVVKALMAGKSPVF